MELRHLDALVAVADHHTFSAAAKALHTVQSNVSTHVARLERELSVELYDRRAGRLTPAGELVTQRARRVRAELTSLAGDVASLRADVVGSTSLGLIGTTGRWMAAGIIRTLASEHPRIDLTVVEATTAGLLPQLSAGRIDLAVVNLPLFDPELEVEPLFEEDLVAVVPASHRWSDRDAVDLEELAAEPIVLGPKGNAVRDVLDEAAATAGLTLRPLAVVDGVRLAASLAFEGFGPAVVPASGIPRFLDGPWAVLAIEGTPRRLVGVARRVRALPSAPTRALTDVLPRVMVEEAAHQPGIHPLAGPAGE